MNSASSFAALAEIWQDAPATHRKIRKDFEESLHTVPELISHRRWIEQNNYGFGEGAFHGVWNLLVTEFPQDFKALEVGVFQGQAISAIDLAAQLQNKKGSVYGLSPFNGADGNYYEKRTNYEDNVEYLFKMFNGNNRPLLIKGYSTDQTAKDAAYALAYFDSIYIDAEHSYEAVLHDLNFYAPLVKVGGYLISDDSAFDLQLPEGWFKGFEGATLACKDYFTDNIKWKFIANVVHMRIYKRISW